MHVATKAQSQSRRPLFSLAMVAGALVTILGFFAGPLATVASAASVSGSSYTALAPYRITDTRTSSGLPNAGKTLAAGGSITVQVSGTGTGTDAVPASATAAVLNVTATNTTAPSYLSVYPAGGTQPIVSSLNFVAGQTVANLVTVPLSSTGAVTIFNYAGSADVVVDVDGFYGAAAATTAGPGLYNAVNPFRALGSVAQGAAIAPATSTPVTVTGGSTGVPTTATAVAVNVTAAGGTAASYLTAYPAGASLATYTSGVISSDAGGTAPTASSLNFSAGQTIANRAIVGVGTAGQIDVYNNSGTVNVDVDIDGYYSGGSTGTGSVFVPITPTRLTDTRTSTNGTPIASGATESFNLSNSTIPATATAVASNFTVVPGASAGYITVYPTSDTSAPTASDVNWVANEGPVPNFTLADTAGTGSVDVYNYVGESTINLVIDAFGYFVPSNSSSTGTGGTTPGGNPPSTTFAITVTPTLTTVSSQPSSTSTLNTTVTGAATSGVPGDEVEYILTPSVPATSLPGSGDLGSCGHLTGAVQFDPGFPPAVTTTTEWYAVTGVGGVISPVPVYVPSKVPGTCTIQAIEADQGTSTKTTITQLPVVNSIALAASPATVTEGGITTTTITATVDGPTGAPLAGDPVTFTETGSEPACGALGPVATVITTATGQASIGYTSDATNPPGSFCVVTATESETHQSTATSIDNTSATSTVATVSPVAIPSTINSTPLGPITPTNNKSKVTVTVTGASTSPIPGDEVSLLLTPSVAATAGAPSSCGKFAGLGPSVAGFYFGVTDAGGVLNGGPVTYTASTTPGTCTVLATEAGNSDSGSVVITQLPVVDTITLTATPASITANGITTTVVTATVTGPTGTPVAGDPVNFSQTGFPASSVCTTSTATAVNTNASGQASITYTSSAHGPGFCAVGGEESETGQLGLTSIDQTSVS